MESNPMQVALNTVRSLRLELMQLFIGIDEGVKDDGSQTESKNNRYLYTMNEMIGKLGLRMRFGSLKVHIDTCQNLNHPNLMIV